MSKFFKTPKVTSKPSYRPIEPVSHAWRPGWRRAPLWGVTGLLLAFASAVAAIFILGFSNGKATDKWTFQPTVYLAISSTITNIALTFALFEGIAISWWRKSLRTDTTVADLHRIWDHGTSFKAAILSGRHVNTVAIACILVALTPVNGPLLQRASTFAPAQLVTSRTVDVKMSALIPAGWTGILSSRGDIVNGFRSNFSAAARDYYSKMPVHMDSECQGTCATKVTGAGFRVACTTEERPYDVGTILLGSTVFMTHVAYYSREPVTVNLTSMYKASQDCVGRLRVQNCTLQAGTVSYAVSIDGPAKTIRLAPGTTIWDDEIVGSVDYLPFEGHNIQNDTSTYGGLFLALANQWNSQIVVEHDPVIGHEVLGAQTEVTLSYAQNFDDILSCKGTFSDPMPDFLESARELMFRAAIASADTTTPVQRLNVTETTNPTVYRTHYLFLSLATAASLIGLVAVLLTYNRFWHLGRPCTLSPIETAKAFNAPLLRGSDSNAPLPELLKVVGPRKVRYGIVRDSGSNVHYSDTAYPPNTNYPPNIIYPNVNHPGYYGKSGSEFEMASFDETGRIAYGAGSQRLELADPNRVTVVVAGSTFRD